MTEPLLLKLCNCTFTLLLNYVSNESLHHVERSLYASPWQLQILSPLCPCWIKVQDYHWKTDWLLNELSGSKCRTRGNRTQMERGMRLCFGTQLASSTLTTLWWPELLPNDKSILFKKQLSPTCTFIKLFCILMQMKRLRVFEYTNVCQPMESFLQFALFGVQKAPLPNPH